MHMKQSMLVSALALLSVSAMAAAEPVAVEQQAPAAVIKQVEPAQVQLKKALNLSAEQMPHWDKMETTFNVLKLQQQMPDMNALTMPERAETLLRLHDERRVRLAAHVENVKALYDALTPAQQLKFNTFQPKFTAD